MKTGGSSRRTRRMTRSQVLDHRKVSGWKRQSSKTAAPNDDQTRLSPAALVNYEQYLNAAKRLLGMPVANSPVAGHRFIPMQGTIKSILNVVVVIAVVLWLLNIFGLFQSLSRIHIGT